MKASKISELLSKINRAAENPAFPAISKIEADLLKQHIRDLYEAVDDLAGQNIPVTKEEITQPVKKHTGPDANIVIKRTVLHANDAMLLADQPPVQKNAVTVKEQVEIITAIKETPAITKPETAVQKPAQVPVSSINESIKSGGSLNEKLKSSSAVEMHKKLASKPLKELIDLNKRFVLVAELFKGNTEAYTNAISHIDSLPDYETAQSFISTQLVTTYLWDESKQSTRMFSKLVKMKFGVE